LFGSPVGKELEVPLAQVVLGGLLSATLLNMLVVPTVYNRVERWRERHLPTPLRQLNSLETVS
jgi:Cu/Ag efflux pump CusA